MIGGSTERATLDGTLRRSVPAGRSLKDARASLGWRHAPRRAVEEPNAETGLQPADGRAQIGGGRACLPRRIAKTAGASDGNEGGEIVEVSGHCRFDLDWTELRMKTATTAGRARSS
jgi:hypothetical protein